MSAGGKVKEDVVRERDANFAPGDLSKGFVAQQSFPSLADFGLVDMISTNR